MAVTFRQLRYFTVLAEELHFGRAAKRLHISQPPLSASLRQLEEELGVQLLERSSRRVALTRAGEVFYRQACRLLSQLGDTQELVRRVAESASGLVRVGFTPTMIFRRLPNVLTDFQRRHPGIDVELVEQNSIAQIEALTLGRIDIGFIHAVPLPPEVASLVIADEEFVCCLPMQHPLAARSAVALRELVGEPMMMFDRSLAPHYYDRIIGMFRLAGVEPTIRHQVSHWLTIMALVAHGVGVSVVPRSLADSGFASVAFVPLADADARHEARCIWLADAADLRRDLLLDCVSAQFHPGGSA